MSEKKAWELNRLKDDQDKLRDKYCELDVRLRQVEKREAEHSASIEHITTLLNEIPRQFQESIAQMEERLTRPLTTYEKAKIGLVVGIVGVIIGMMLDGGG